MPRRPLRTLTAAAGLALLTSGLVACGTGGSVVSATSPPPVGSEPATTPRAPDTPRSDEQAPRAPGTIAPNDDGRRAAPDGTKWKVRLTEGMVPDRTWPDARTFLSHQELEAIFPDAESIRVASCRRAEELGAKRAHHTECEWTITMPGDSRTLPSEIDIRLARFGPRQEMFKEWDLLSSFDEKRARESPDDYTYYEDGAFGAAKVFADGTNQVRVLLANDEVAGTFYISCLGFYGLAGGSTDFEESEQALKEQIMPLIITTLAAHMP